MSLPKSFLSGDPVVSLHGQWMHLPPYILQPGDEALDKEQYGTCYTRELINSPWGTFYAGRLRAHALERGLQPLGRRGEWEVFRYPNVRQIEGIRNDGFELTLPMRELRQVNGTPRISIEEEFNLVLDDHPQGAQIMAPIQQALREEGTYPLWKALDALAITHHLWREPLEHGEFRRDDEEMIYWTTTGISVRAAYDVEVPWELVDLLD